MFFIRYQVQKNIELTVFQKNLMLPNFNSTPKINLISPVVSPVDLKSHIAIRSLQKSCSHWIKQIVE